MLDRNGGGASGGSFGDIVQTHTIIEHGAGTDHIYSGGGIKEGSTLRARFYQQYPAYKTLLNQVQKTAERGYLFGIDGRRLQVRSLHSALNLLIQSAGAILCSKWLVLFDEKKVFFPSVRNIYGAIAVFSFTLYPYVYLVSRMAFVNQSISIIEAGRILGLSRVGAFFKLSIPLIRPAIFAGLALVIMETLSDFGAVDFFSINTLTTAIYLSLIHI